METEVAQLYQTEEQFQNFLSTLPRLTKRQYFTGRKITLVQIKPILDFLKTQGDHRILRLAEAVNVSPNTLYNWELKLRIDPQFNPLLSLRNRHRNLLSEDLEDLMIKFIYKNYLKPGFYFDNKICRGVCLRLFHLYARGADLEKDLKASRSWVTNFMARHGYHLRKAHLGHVFIT